LIRYYTRTRDRHKGFVPGDKPEALRRLSSIDESVWEQYDKFTNRITPLERGEFYRRL